MARSDISDLDCEFIKDVLPDKVRGKKRVDDRRVSGANARRIILRYARR